MLPRARSFASNVSRWNRQHVLFIRQIHSSFAQLSAAANKTHDTISTATSTHHGTHDPHHPPTTSHGSHGEEAEEYNEMEGWFLGEKPGYKGDELPGGTSRQLSRVLLFGYVTMIGGTYWVINNRPETTPTIWAKEYVLNVEKYKAPKVADFPPTPTETEE